VIAGKDVLNLEAYQVTGSKLAIDGEVEKSQVSPSAPHFQPKSDRPHILGLQRALLANKLALVPGSVGGGYRV
jgi:hypothetical protein